MYYSRLCREAESIEWRWGREREKERAFKELVHTIVETDKSSIGQQAGDPGKC